MAGKMEKHHRVSASQIKTWKMCPRKWGFKYIEVLEDPPGKAAILGTKVHEQLEWWLQAGSINSTLPEGKIAKAATKHLPGPSYQNQVEREIIFDRAGVTFRGFVDLIDPTEKRGPLIYDHKTSSDPKRWGLTPETLPEDPQAIIYAIWGLEEFGLDSVELQWTYLKTRGAPEATEVRARISKDEAEAKFDSIVRPAALAIVDAAQNCERATDLPAEVSGCSKFGGCPFAGVCPRTTDELIEQTLGQNEKEKGKMSLKQLLKQKKMAPPRANEFAKIMPPEVDAKTEPEAPTPPAADAPVAINGQDEILQKIRESGGVFTFSKSRATATAEVPFAHGRSLMTLKKDGRIKIEDEGKTRRCSLADSELATAPAPALEVVEDTAPAPQPETDPEPEIAPEPREFVHAVEPGKAPTKEQIDDRRGLFFAMAAKGYTPDYIEQILDLFDARIVSWSEK